MKSNLHKKLVIYHMAININKSRNGRKSLHEIFIEKSEIAWQFYAVTKMIGHRNPKKITVRNIWFSVHIRFNSNGCKITNRKKRRDFSSCHLGTKFSSILVFTASQLYLQLKCKSHALFKTLDLRTMQPLYLDQSCSISLPINSTHTIKCRKV